ncbi:hypothetical protein JoomaDRAFT_2609 [Galbibacter orientalis DSM 19592]|uniref:Uncharacterized protein n=1 Tax=Galbibacter orientalis DSM 19592 TaxID=926559 RepID=I3C7I8_9FLAO|nr:hypothetical protein JoomaDRAFT_2609 [Galbibacter orientalis DSM 19592]
MPKIGFSNFERFVTPIYDKKNKAFTSYGIIFWSPELKFNEDGNIISKEYYENLNKLHLYLELRIYIFLRKTLFKNGMTNCKNRNYWYLFAQSFYIIYF